MQVISKPKELTQILYMSCFPTMQSNTGISGTSMTLFCKLTYNLGVAQSLQNNVQMTFVQFYLTQSVLGPTMKEYVVKVMKRVGTV